MLSTMSREPFYVVGTYSCPELAIYCGWMAHQNSFASGQLFRSDQHDITLVFSGECFLDQAIKDLLRQRGHVADPNRGTWLIPLYLELGDRFFEQLNGLFSGLLLDLRQRKAFLFNDRYGMERIYWHESNEAFYFASEAKALLRILPELRKFDRNGVADYLKFGCTICPRTLFQGIESVPPASLWCFEHGHQARRKYFDFNEWEAQAAYSAPDFRAAFDQTFQRILPRYLEARAQIGISLTAGLDGRVIMACLPHQTVRPVCYTFAGESENLLDAKIAAKVAAASGCEHYVVRIGPDFFRDFISHLDKTIYVTDGCLGALGTHEIYFNEGARRLAQVRLTGVFGGEVFREVSFYKPVGFNRELLNPDWNTLVEGTGSKPYVDKLHPLTTALTREIPHRRFGVIAAGRSQTFFRTPYLDNELVALAYRIPPPFRASPEPMTAAVKNNHETLSRIPTDMGFLGNDAPIASAVRQLFGRATFKLDYYYSEGLPESLERFNPIWDRLNKSEALFGRHKFLRYRSWLQHELADLVSDRIDAALSCGSELWNVSYLRTILADYRRGTVNYTKEINLVLTFEAVQRLLCRPFGSETAATRLAICPPMPPVVSSL